VTHPDFTEQLDAYLDGELAPGDAAALEAHLRECRECARLERDRRRLSDALRAHLPQFRAPDGLRDRVRDAVQAEAGRGARRRPSPWYPLAAAACLAVVAVASWQVLLRRSAAAAIADQVLAGHLRSLVPGHLTDVASSDQHTVKPWFDGKLDFSPTVSDFAGQGYPLIGGRLDYVGGRAVAALVYGRRRHVINVFLWPGGGAGPTALATVTLQGYHLLHWTTPDYTWWVASDLGLPELRAFANLLERGDSAALAP
jgi:anti-sigma factor RsiW